MIKKRVMFILLLMVLLCSSFVFSDKLFVGESTTFNTFDFFDLSSNMTAQPINASLSINNPRSMVTDDYYNIHMLVRRSSSRRAIFKSSDYGLSWDMVFDSGINGAEDTYVGRYIDVANNEGYVFANAKSSLIGSLDNGSSYTIDDANSCPSGLVVVDSVNLSFCSNKDLGQIKKITYSGTGEVVILDRTETFLNGLTNDNNYVYVLNSSANLLQINFSGSVNDLGIIKSDTLKFIINNNYTDKIYMGFANSPYQLYTHNKSLSTAPVNIYNFSTTPTSATYNKENGDMYFGLDDGNVIYMNNSDNSFSTFTNVGSRIYVIEYMNKPRDPINIVSYLYSDNEDNINFTNISINNQFDSILLRTDIQANYTNFKIYNTSDSVVYNDNCSYNGTDFYYFCEDDYTFLENGNYTFSIFLLDIYGLNRTINISINSYNILSEIDINSYSLFEPLNLSVTLNYSIVDDNNQNMNVTFYYCNNTIIDTYNNLTEDTYYINYTFSNYNLSECFYINVYDGFDYVNSSTFNMSSGLNSYPYASIYYPLNNSVNVSLSFYLNLSVFDDNTNIMILYIYFNDTLLDTITNLSSSDNVLYLISNLTYNTSYQYYINISDNYINLQSDIYNFQTVLNQYPTYILVEPDINETDTSLEVTINFLINDFENDTMNITLYDYINGSILDSQILNDNENFIYLWQNLNYFTTYKYYIIITDSYNNTIMSTIYQFKTKEERTILNVSDELKNYILFGFAFLLYIVTILIILWRKDVASVLIHIVIGFIMIVNSFSYSIGLGIVFIILTLYFSFLGIVNSFKEEK